MTDVSPTLDILKFTIRPFLYLSEKVKHVIGVNFPDLQNYLPFKTRAFNPLKCLFHYYYYYYYLVILLWLSIILVIKNQRRCLVDIREWFTEVLTEHCIHKSLVTCTQAYVETITQ